RRATDCTLRPGNWLAISRAETTPARSRITLSSLSVQRLTAASLMRQSLQRLNSIKQLLLLNVRVCPVPLQCLLCCCQLGGAGVGQIGLVVLDRCRCLADQDKPVAMLHTQSEVLNAPVVAVTVDVQLDGISDSCHDDLGFSLLTFSPSLEGLFYVADTGRVAVTVFLRLDADVISVGEKPYFI